MLKKSAVYEFRVRRHKRTAMMSAEIGTQGHVLEFLMSQAELLDRETFWTIHLDPNSRVIGFEVVAVGNLLSVEVHPREVFRGALLAGAARIIVAHNHPSGGLEHSLHDLALITQLHEAGKVVGIPVLDSVVVTGTDYKRIESMPL